MYAPYTRRFVAFYMGNCPPGGIVVEADHPDELVHRMSEAAPDQSLRAAPLPYRPGSYGGSPAMIRATWEDLPEPVCAAVEAEFGPVLKAETVTSRMPGLAVRLDTGNSRAFLKAVATDNPAAILYRRERWANRNLHEETPAPRLLWSATLHGWEIMLSEYVDDCHLADLSPGSADLAPVLDTIALLGALLTPCPQGALSVSDNVAALQAKAHHLIARTSGTLAERDPYVAALDQFSIEDLRGNTLLHFDLSDSNLLSQAGECM